MTSLQPTFRSSSSSPPPPRLDTVLLVDDIFHDHVMPFLTYREASRLERASKSVYRKQREQERPDSGAYLGWKALCARDYVAVADAGPDDDPYGVARQPHGGVGGGIAPVYSRVRRSFDALRKQKNWKDTYRVWKEWERRTGGGIRKEVVRDRRTGEERDEYTYRGILPEDMVASIRVWTRIRRALQGMGLVGILRTLCPCPSRAVFEALIEQRAPSCLLAVYAVHGGQLPQSSREACTGLLGSHGIDDYSMHLIRAEDVVAQGNIGYTMNRKIQTIRIGESVLGLITHFLYLVGLVDSESMRWSVVMNPTNRENDSFTRAITVCRGDILEYLQTYADRLSSGFYRSGKFRFYSGPSGTGISLLPDGCVTNNVADGTESTVRYASRHVAKGIEVRASSRCLPFFSYRYRHGMHFTFSIRIRMLPVEEMEGQVDHSSLLDQCQLVSHDFEITDGDGGILHFQDSFLPLEATSFYRNKRGSKRSLSASAAATPTAVCGYKLVGIEHDDQVFACERFCGPVKGTRYSDTKLASMQGTLGFVPGSEERPTGPVFHVPIARFSLAVPRPFY